MKANKTSGAGRLSRRDFSRLLALGGSSVAFAHPLLAWRAPAPLPPAPAIVNDGFWKAVREQFLMPPDLAVMNAANLCPSSAPVLQAMYEKTREMDREPSPAFRNEMHEVKEETRKLLAEFLHVSTDEIVITRNTSEANNLVSSGLDLKAGDEVVIFADNHPSHNAAWKEKAKRFGFTVKIVEAVNPHPGPEYYVETFQAQMTARTKVVAFTHLTSTVGDLFPAKEICRLARERGVLSVVDGAQSFGLIDVSLADMQPDFYTGSAHKWPCGPKETGLLYINTRAQSRIWPSIISAYPGSTGISRSFEGFGQRDEPAIYAFGESLKFQMKIGKKLIEDRARELAQGLMEGFRKVDDVRIWTSADPSRSVAVVSVQPGSLDPRKLTAALYEKDRIVCATRGGADRGGVRFSPHFYNSPAEIERAVAAVRRYLGTGL